MRLSQVIALEKETKTQSTKDLTALYQIAQKQDPFNGLTRIYKKKAEDGEDFPPEVKKIQLNGLDIPQQMKFISSEYLDLSFTKDDGNCKAVADIIVGETTIAEKVPVTFLLTLEKFLVDLRTTIGALPTLDPTETWEWNEGEGYYKSKEAVTHRTKKMQKPIVLYDATPEHPAQTQLITEDEVVGYWHNTKTSTALPENKKKELFRKLEELIKAVKSARELANTTPVEKKGIAHSLFNYLLT